MNDILTWCLIAFLLALGAAGMVLVSELVDNPTPSPKAEFQGRPVKAWLDDLRGSDFMTKKEAMEVLGTMGPTNQDAVPELIQALRDGEPLVRVGAARALGRIGPPAREALAGLEAASEVGYGADLREMIQARRSIQGRTQPAKPLAAEVIER